MILDGNRVLNRLIKVKYGKITSGSTGRSRTPTTYKMQLYLTTLWKRLCTLQLGQRDSLYLLTLSHNPQVIHDGSYSENVDGSNFVWDYHLLTE